MSTIHSHGTASLISRLRLHFSALVIISIVIFAGHFQADAQTSLPTFSKAFSPDIIGPGGTSTLTFTIENSGGPVDNISFTDNLPTGVAIASPSNSMCDCDGVLVAQDGTTSISFTGGRLGSNEDCTITVDVTSSIVGLHTNTTGDLTSSAGNSGSAQADLTVDANRPGFTMNLTPSAIAPGGTSKLTLNIDNSQNAIAGDLLNFTVILPEGLEFASPKNLFTDCTPSLFQVGNLTANAGVLFFQGYMVAPGGNCTVSVDVTAITAGNFLVSSGELLSGNSTQISSGFASAQLSSVREFLVKSFIDDPVIPGDLVTINYTLTNFDRRNTASNISFTDDLDALISGLVATGLPSDVCGGTVSGTSVISYSGGSLAPEESCSFQVVVQVPSTAAPDNYTSTSSDVTYDLDGSPVTANPASAELLIQAAPRLTKEFVDDLDNPITEALPGDAVTLRFTIENTSTTAMSDIAFTDNLSQVPVVISSMLPISDLCGSGSTLTSSILLDDVILSFTGGSLDPLSSCTFEVELTVPGPGAGEPAPGMYTNTTSVVTATVGSQMVQGGAASADLAILVAPTLAKEFSVNQIIAEQSLTLDYTLNYNENAVGDATNISFTEDLNAHASDLTFTVGTLPSGSCGTGSLTVDGSNVLSFSGGTLIPGSSCSISIPLTVAAATSGVYNFATSDVTSSVLGQTVTSAPASVDLEVPSLVFTKEFLDDPVLPGNTVIVEYRLSNTSSVDLTSISFVDDLNSTLAGLTPMSALPLTDICGTGSSLNLVGAELRFIGGNILAGQSCSFTVVLSVPAGAEQGIYPSLTEPISALVDGVFTSFGSASDKLSVIPPDLLTLSKAYGQDEAAPGDLINLDFAITFEGQAIATGINFTDDLSVPGLIITQIMDPGTCSATIGTVNSNLVSFTMGSLSPGTACSFSVELRVPDDAVPGTEYTNVTSNIMADGGIIGNAATDILTIVEEARAPTARAGDDQMVECDGVNGTQVTLDGSNSDFSPPASFTWTDELENIIAMGPVANVTLGLGVHTIQLTVTDAFGSGSDDVIITIQDTQDPVIFCPDGSGTSFTLIVDANCETMLPDYTNEAVVSDNCTLLPTVTQSPAPDALLSGHGTTQVVTLTADDGNGNTAECSFIVTLEDDESPVITLNGDNPETVFRFSGPYFDPGAQFTDNCDDPSSNVTVSGLVETNLVGSYILTYSASDLAGNAAPEVTRTVVVIDDPNVLEHNLLLLADQNITASKVERLDGPIHANALISIGKGFGANQGGPTVYDSDMTAVNQITVSRDNNVNGDLTAPSVSVANNVNIVGVVTEAPVTAVGLPTLSIMAGGNDQTVLENTTIALLPGSYGTLLVKSGATLQVMSGEYSFTGITFENNANLEVDIPTGPVAINSETQILIFEDVTMTMTPGGNMESEYLKIQSLTDIFIQDRAIVLGQLIAPNGQVNLGGDVQLRGSICANFINITGGTDVIHHDAISTTGLQPSDPKILTFFSGEVRAKPNPFTERLEISGSFDELLDSGILRIVDISNREIFQQKIQTNAFEINVNTSEWTSGMYFIVTNMGGESKTLKILKIN